MTALKEKPWWASKTIWVNIIAGVAAISTAFGLDLGLDAEAQAALVGGVMALVNVILRIVTKRPVTLRRDGARLQASALAGCAAMLAALLMLGACASPVAETPAQRVYALQADYNAALAAAVAYESQPRCEQGETSLDACSEADVVAALRRADNHAFDALQAAQAAVRESAGAGAVETALIAAREGVAALRKILVREGVIR